ncbi:hypothetical protein TL18_03060 [Methanobrevibacter sp. YE315]|uniref:hypothetical protein n=1 Tax=Methanobrevibacter sp. YE315 TaxID=1609968 RepID=UPI000764E616|nr:hypothetical protein [Methanobrevibacter sp. YE315]AMD17090.1 hypothetical protein TL18_03060 [Methanobrevibacter sp. YE315]
MNKQDFNIKTKIIRETFNDTRTIKCPAHENDMEFDESTYELGDIFTTTNGEVIDLEFQIDDFTVDELVKYVEIAEKLYEINRKHVSIYIICPDTVEIRVKECEIKSEADFTIKLASINENPAQIALKLIKEKLNNGEILNEDDLHALTLIPLMCKKEDRNYFRKECFEIINQIF